MRIPASKPKLTLQGQDLLLHRPHILVQQHRSVVEAVMYRLLGGVVLQLPLVNVMQVIKAVLTWLEGNHLVQDVAHKVEHLVIVAAEQELRTEEANMRQQAESVKSR